MWFANVPPQQLRRLRDRLELVQGDIVDQDVDAVVNAANTSLLGGGGVDGAIHRAAGPELLEACRALGGCPTGSAKITSGFRLKARHVIHAVGPVYTGSREDQRLLASTYRSAMDLAIEHRLHSIAFPSISTGAFGYPVELAAGTALFAVASKQLFMNGSEQAKPMRVRFVLFDSATLRAYRSALTDLLQDN